MAPRSAELALRECWWQRRLCWRETLRRMRTRSWMRLAACFAAARDIARSSRRFLMLRKIMLGLKLLVQRRARQFHLRRARPWEKGWFALMGSRRLTAAKFLALTRLRPAPWR